MNQGVLPGFEVYFAPPTLTDLDRRVIAVLQGFARGGRGCFPKQATLLAALNNTKSFAKISLRTLQKSLARLRQWGLRTVQRGRTSAMFFLADLLSRIASCVAKVHSEPARISITESTQSVNLKLNSPAPTPAESRGSDGAAVCREPDGEPTTPFTATGRFREYIGVFLAAGKSLSQGDIRIAQKLWPGVPEQHAISDIRDIVAKRKICFVPMPANHLRSESWARVAVVDPEALRMQRMIEMVKAGVRRWAGLEAL